MKLFWVLWVIDAITALITVYFFFDGLADGSVSSFNIVSWLIILLVLAAILTGSLYLKSYNRVIVANILLSLLAAPALLYGLFLLLVISSGARWN